MNNPSTVVIASKTVCAVLLFIVQEVKGYIGGDYRSTERMIQGKLALY